MPLLAPPVWPRTSTRSPTTGMMLSGVVAVEGDRGDAVRGRHDRRGAQRRDRGAVDGRLGGGDGESPQEALVDVRAGAGAHGASAGAAAGSRRASAAMGSWRRTRVVSVDWPGSSPRWPVAPGAV